MNLQQLSIIAGTISSLIFASSNIPMLWKAYRTRDLRSYSGLNVVMVNIGNLLYWLYVANLPLGPIWILHTFYTIASGIVLIMYIRFHPGRLIPWCIRPACLGQSLRSFYLAWKPIKKIRQIIRSALPGCGSSPQRRSVLL